MTSMIRRATWIARTPLGIQDSTGRPGQLLKTIRTEVLCHLPYEVLKDDPGKDLLHLCSLREHISSEVKKPLRGR